MSASDESSRRRDNLKKHLSAIADNKDTLIKASEQKRWFRFQNSINVIFDRKTNLLWLDHKDFPYGKTVKKKNEIPYSIDNGYAEVRKMLSEKNKHWIGNCTDWSIPTVDEFRQLIQDKTFPLYQEIKKKRKWCTQSGCIDLDQESFAVSLDDAFVIPCSHAYVPSTPKSTLDIFIDNLLDPIFDNNLSNELYRRLYSPAAYPTIRKAESPHVDCFQKSDLLDYIADLESKITQFKSLADSAQRILQ